MTKQHKELEEKIKELTEENNLLKERFNKLYDDFEYAKLFYEEKLNKIDFEKFLRLNYYYIKNNGFFKFLWQCFRSVGKVFKIMHRKCRRRFRSLAYKRELKSIIKKHSNREIMVFYPGYEWYMKMYQRPQHMAIHFAEKGILFFYCSTNISDNIDGFVNIQDNLYITNQYELLKKYLPNYTLYMCANMNGCFKAELLDILRKGNKVLYEYIDDLHEDLTSITPKLLERHEYVLKKEEIPVLATAQHLYKKAMKIRGSEKNLLLTTNGVVYEDFHITKELPIPDSIKTIVNEGKPIIGYYGALAKWFDYELVEKLALKHKDWNILLIGIDYDKSFSKYDYFKYLKNVYYIGTVEYKELIKYGNCCSVLTIPFLINEITLSTSPVKVFEYMSMEKPIVTTDLPECRKYKSVLISKNHDEFISNIEKGLKLQNDKKYKELLRKEALDNTWTNKVNEILDFLRKKGK